MLRFESETHALSITRWYPQLVFFAWNEIATRDTDAVSSFYCTLFGWSAEDASHTPAYTKFNLGDHPLAA